MKKILFTLASSLLIGATAFAQAPQGFNYQAVIRDASNIILNNQAVGVELKIHQGTPVGPVAYAETFAPTTNTNGLVNLEIGAGTVVAGDFTTIDWAGGPYFIETSVDVTGGSSFVSMGTSQLLSVPYALHAANGKWDENGTDIYNANSGLVGIGTSSPLSDLHIDQSGGITTNEGTGGLNLANGVWHWRIYNSQDYVRFNYSNDSGSTYTPLAFINSSNGSWNQLSDASLKTDVELMGPVISKLKELVPLQYHYIHNSKKDPLSIGFFAHEVKKLFPNAVSQEEGEVLLGIDYSQFAVISIKAIQEQQEVIESQQVAIESQQETITALENKLENEASENKELKKMILELAKRVEALEK